MSQFAIGETVKVLSSEPTVKIIEATVFFKDAKPSCLGIIRSAPWEEVGGLLAFGEQYRPPGTYYAVEVIGFRKARNPTGLWNIPAYLLEKLPRVDVTEEEEQKALA